MVFLRTHTVIDLQDEFTRCRLSIRELHTALRALPAEELEKHAHRGVQLSITRDELSPLAAIGRDGEIASPWQKAVVDSVALAILWSEIADTHLPALEAAPPEKTALIHEFQVLSAAVRDQIDMVAGSLGDAGPKISNLLERARWRVEHIGALARGDGPKKTGAAERAPANPDSKPVPFEVETFLEPAFAALQESIGGHYLLATKIGVATTGGMSKLSPFEASAIGACRSGLIEGASPHHRLLATIATLSVWIAAARDRLIVPEDFDAPTFADPPADRSSALGAIAALAPLAQVASQASADRGDPDFAQAIAPSLARLEELQRLAEELPEARGSGSLAFQSVLSIKQFDSRAVTGSADPAEDTIDRELRRENPVPRERSRAARPGWSQLAIGQKKALGAGFLSLVVIGLAIAHVTSLVIEEGRPAAVQAVGLDELTEIFPSAVLPARTDESTEARVGVGPEWLDWDARERRRRIGQACVVLGNKAWRSALFLGPDGLPVATWRDGAVIMHAAPEDSTDPADGPAL